ncbi:MAG TPA: hypothetical protein VK157_09940 [Phycisphaerales bacterium]|nr:hypothetical protein [Phycisphaerales bacterium]
MSTQPKAHAATATLHTSAHFALVLRKHVTHALVAAVLAGAAWTLGVRPLEAAMARNKQESARMAADASASSMTTAPQEDITSEIKSVTQRVDTTVAWASQMDDATEIYDAFMRVARSTSVNVQRIDPTGTRPFTPRTLSKAATPSKTPTGPTAELTGYRVQVQGTYAQLVDFMGACETQLGATRIVSFRISPSALVEESARTAGVIEASIETSHVKLTLPPAGNRNTTEARGEQ